MASRTYLVGLYLVFQAAHKYGSRWQQFIESHLANQAQIDCFRAALLALANCLPFLIPSIGE